MGWTSRLLVHRLELPVRRQPERPSSWGSAGPIFRLRLVYSSAAILRTRKLGAEGISMSVVEQPASGKDFKSSGGSARRVRAHRFPAFSRRHGRGLVVARLGDTERRRTAPAVCGTQVARATGVSGVGSRMRSSSSQSETGSRARCRCRESLRTGTSRSTDCRGKARRGLFQARPPPPRCRTRPPSRAAPWPRRRSL